MTLELDKAGVDGATSAKILEAMAAKSIDELAALVEGVDSASVDEMRTLFEYAEAYGFKVGAHHPRTPPVHVSRCSPSYSIRGHGGMTPWGSAGQDYLIFDASVVRGLAYYTGIVFECFDRRGELRAICGGGRYDRLLSLYGSPADDAVRPSLGLPPAPPWCRGRLTVCVAGGRRASTSGRSRAWASASATA